jgi:hypothetical protein
MRALKSGRLIGVPPESVSTQVANAFGELARMRADLAPFIGQGTVFVPVPSSSLQVEGALWIPNEIAKALSQQTDGSRVAALLRRILPIPKAATSIASNRPTALRHFETLGVQKDLLGLETVTLVDDVVTSGAALLGSANRLVAAFPKCQVRGFAGIRTISNHEELESRVDPIVGRIRLQSDGRCSRRP